MNVQISKEDCFLILDTTTSINIHRQVYTNTQILRSVTYLTKKRKKVSGSLRLHLLQAASTLVKTVYIEMSFNFKCGLF